MAITAATSGEAYGFDRWGNKVWMFGDKAIRVDDSGPEPMFCLKDCIEVNGLRPQSGHRMEKIKDHRGSAIFTTPGGAQSLVTISEEGFYILSMRGNKPVSEEFRRMLARVATQLRKTGRATMADVLGQPARPQSAMDVIRHAVLAQQQQAAISLQILDQLADQERQIARTRAAADEAIARLDRLEEEQQAATTELLSLPAPTVPAPPETTRQKLLALVRSHCRSSGLRYATAFGELYRQIYYRLRIDLAALKRNRPGKEKLDLLDESGRIEEAYAIACEIFPARPIRVAD